MTESWGDSTTIDDAAAGCHDAVRARAYVMRLMDMVKERDVGDVPYLFDDLFESIGQMDKRLGWIFDRESQEDD